MNLKNSFWQFVKDGLVGVAVGLIPIGISIGILLFTESWSKEEWFDFAGSFFFFQNRFISPMPFVMLTGFISMGIGGRFLENVTTRLSWIKPIFIISIVSWILGVVIISILFSGLRDQQFLNLMAISTGIGFLISGLMGMVFNPSNTWWRLIIGAVASTVASNTLGVVIFAIQILSL